MADSLSRTSSNKGLVEYSDEEEDIEENVTSITHQNYTHVNVPNVSHAADIVDTSHTLPQTSVENEKYDASAVASDVIASEANDVIPSHSDEHANTNATNGMAVHVPNSSACSQCETGVAKYTCPACGTRTCSLTCSRSHKAATSCNGRRNPVAVVDMSSLQPQQLEAVLASDFRFLEDVARKADTARRIALDKGTLPVSSQSHSHARQDNNTVTGTQPLPPRLHLLRKHAQERGVNVMFLPNGMTRRINNTSSVTTPGNGKRADKRKRQGTDGNSGEKQVVDTEVSVAETVVSPIATAAISSHTNAIDQQPDKSEPNEAMTHNQSSPTMEGVLRWHIECYCAHAVPTPLTVPFPNILDTMTWEQVLGPFLVRAAMAGTARMFKSYVGKDTITRAQMGPYIDMEPHASSTHTTTEAGTQVAAETASSSSTRLSPADSVLPILLFEHPFAVSGKRIYSRLSWSSTVRDSLRGFTVLEYPTVVLALPQRMSEFPLLPEGHPVPSPTPETTPADASNDATSRSGYRSSRGQNRHTQGRFQRGRGRGRGGNRSNGQMQRAKSQRGK